MPDFVLQAGKFNIVPTIIAIGSGVALLGAVSNSFKYSVGVSVDNWCFITVSLKSEKMPSYSAIRG